MKIKNYWWEEELIKLLRDYQENDYTSNSDIKLFVLKIIETEKNETNETI